MYARERSAPLARLVYAGSLSALLLVLVAACVAACAGRPAQKDPPAEVTTDAFERCRALVELALTQGQAYQLLRELTTEAPKRLAGSPGDVRAQEWAITTMRRIGLSNVRREPVTVTRWERGAVERVRLVTEDGGRDLPCTALGGSVGTSGLEGDVVVVRSPLELEQLDASGKIVLFNRPMPRALRNTFQAYSAAVPQRSSGPIEAARRGAIACLVRSMTTQSDDQPHTGATNYALGARRIPALAISTLAADELAAMQARGQTPRVRIESSARTVGEAESANVIGEVPGRSRPDEIVVVGAHLDAWDIGQGAHDDGAGVVHCLEALRLLLASGLQPERTIRCVLFANEENGLRGAQAYFETHEMDQHKAAIESDRGGFEPRGFTTSAHPERREALRAMLAPLDAEIDAGRVIGGGGGADIAPLGTRGVDLFGLLPAWHRYFDYHHSDLDRLEAVNPRELQLGAVALAWLSLSLANETNK